MTRMRLRKPTSATEAVIDAIAVYRLVRLVQEDDVWPFLELRNWWMTKFENSRLADLVKCPFCLGLHMAVIVAVARHKWPRGWPWIARILVGSATAGHLAHLSSTRDW
jgi:hypothetical protein